MTVYTNSALVYLKNKKKELHSYFDFQDDGHYRNKLVVK
jgi:hypothetical protein